MERNYRIELLDIASDNIDEIAVYIAKDLGNRRAAEKLIEKIYKRIGQLEKFPQANPLYFPPDEEPLSVTPSAAAVSAPTRPSTVSPLRC